MTDSFEYFSKYENLHFYRDENGILEVRMHTNEGLLIFTGKTHREFPDVFYDISRDRDNRVVILTGMGNAWMAEIDFASLGDVTNPITRKNRGKESDYKTLSASSILSINFIRI